MNNKGEIKMKHLIIILLFSVLIHFTNGRELCIEGRSHRQTYVDDWGKQIVVWISGRGEVVRMPKDNLLYTKKIDTCKETK